MLRHYYYFFSKYKIGLALMLLTYPLHVVLLIMYNNNNNNNNNNK